MLVHTPLLDHLLSRDQLSEVPGPLPSHAAKPRPRIFDVLDQARGMDAGRLQVALPDPFQHVPSLALTTITQPCLLPTHMQYPGPLDGDDGDWDAMPHHHATKSPRGRWQVRLRVALRTLISPRPHAHF